MLALAAFLFLAQPAAPEVHVDSETGERYVLERPDEGPARGRWSVPAWVVGVGAGVVVIGAGATLGLRLRKRSR